MTSGRYKSPGELLSGQDGQAGLVMVALPARLLTVE